MNLCCVFFKHDVRFVGCSDQVLSTNRPPAAPWSSLMTWKTQRWKSSSWSGSGVLTRTKWVIQRVSDSMCEEFSGRVNHWTSDSVNHDSVSQWFSNWPCFHVTSPQCTKQILSEKLGRGSRTVDLELEAHIDVLRDNKRKYELVVKLAQTLASQLAQMMQTQRQLGDAFADLSLKTPELHVSQ